MRPEPTFAEKAFTVLALMLSSGAVVALWRQTNDAAPDLVDGDPLMQVVLFGVYAVSLVLLVLRCPGFAGALGRERLLLLFLALVFASIIWSDAPDLTARRASALAATTLLGAYLGLRYSLREQVDLLAIALGLVAVLSLATGLFLPAYGISDEAYDGAWRGVFVHKNQFGRMMALTGVVGWLLVRRRGGARLVGAAMMVLAGALISLAQSRTSLLIYASVVLVAQLARVRTSRWRALLVGGTVALVTAATAFIDGEAIFGALGRDSSLTGRTGLWEMAVEMISQRPLLGYGYAAFWRGWEGASAYVWQIAGWEVPHAHNGYLDLCLSVGVVSTVVLLAGLLVTARRALTARTTDTPEQIWPLVYLAFTLLSNLTESALAAQNSVFWVLYVAAVVTVGRQARAVAA